MTSYALVCDNRDSLNWGCRATSAALSEVVEGWGPVVARVHRQAVTRRTVVLPAPGPLGHGRAGRARTLLLDRAVPRVLPQGVTSTGRRVGWWDLASIDPEETARRIRRAAGTDSASAQIMQAFDRADEVVVNGEGSVILSDPPRRDMLMQMGVIALGHHLGQPVHYVNAMVSDDPRAGRAAAAAAAARTGLRLATSVVVRERRSLATLADLAPDVRASAAPDALFTWAPLIAAGGLLPPDRRALTPPGWLDGTFLDLPSPGAPFVALGGSSRAAPDQTAAVEAYTALARSLVDLGTPVVLVQTCTGDRFLVEVARRLRLPLVPVPVPIMQGAALLASATVFVSGRYHPAIMASLGGAALVTLEGNSHKMQGLSELLGRNAAVHAAVPGSSERAAVLAEVEEALAEPSEARERRRAVAARLGAEASGLKALVVGGSMEQGS